MAFPKHIIAITLVAYFSFECINASPTTEYAEFRAHRSEYIHASRISPVRAPRANPAPVAQERSCLASIIDTFFTLMEHAGNAAPHPTMYRRNN